MNRVDVLDTAKEYVTKDRATTHGEAENNFSLIASYWDVYLGADISRTLTPTDVAMMMVLFKVARQHGNPSYEDNYIDAAGYISLASELSSGPGY